ncbi:ATP-binding protein [Alteromonas gilva]|uniref:histidine kinase n=1 Tax=Alteromonas gilva TaxID=2987522 RepID=A0ABT5L1L5_9ALTE|nr:ATP-binding protein [Alteromonas gilva]MDC8830773.1 ATP-binding protein [Alteromonas gilva]
MSMRFSFPLFALTAVFFVGVITYFADQKIVSAYNKTLVADFDINLSEIETLISSEYRAFKEDITFLYSTPPISGLTRAATNDGVDPLDGTTTELWKGRLSNIFTSFMENNQAYFQLRVIDAKGQEMLRVERLNGKVVPRASNDLQNKSERYYFTETTSLHEEQLFVSVIDLNREFGRITFPYQPTLRLAKPIYDEANQLFGIVIANVDVSYLLNALDHLVTKDYQVLLTDVDGYFIKHPDTALQYSRDLAAKQMLHTTYLQRVHGDTSLVNYQKDDALLWGKSTRLVVAAHERGGQLTATILLPDSYYAAALNNRRADTFIALFGVLVLSLLALYMLHRNNRRLSSLLSVAEEAKAAVDVAEDAIITVDKQWRINTVNYAFERLFNAHLNAVKGKPVAAFLGYYGDEELAHRIANADNTFDFSGYDWQPSCHDNGIKWLHTKVAKIDNRDSNAAYAIAVSDITSEKQAQLDIVSVNKGLEKTIAKRTFELEKARDKALEVSQLKSNFISTISHEMRTPLNGIVGATGLLKQEPLNTKQKKLVQMAENSVESLRRLINDILDLSKIEAGKLELEYQQFNPEALLESITSTMSVVANEKRLGFYIDTNDLHFVSINSDPHRLTQVINNLLSNAIKFTQNGHIAVKAWSEITATTSYLHVEIADTGIGIAEAKLARLFNAFTQADNTISARYGGTGLGLSISKEIITILGGKISVSSQPGKGSVFTFTVPTKEWQEKPNDGNARLANSSVGIMIATPPLRDVISRFIVNNQGTLAELSAPITPSDLAPLSLLIVDSEHPDYEAFTSFWLSLTGDEPLPKLVILSEQVIPTADLPVNAINLVKPVYRSVLLSTLLNARSNDTPSLTTDTERRGHDIPGKSNQALKNRVLSGNILVVDDNEINTQVARYILEPLGSEILIAKNGQEAITMLKEASQPFNAVLMDCNMPVMDGYEATKAIRNGAAGEDNKTIPIIAMTANAMQGESEKCYAAGMSDFITKPVDPVLLERKLAQHMGAALTENEQLTADAPPQAQYTAPASNELWQKDQALERLGRRENLMTKLIQLFIASSEQKMQDLNNALAEQNREGIRFAAHAFKGNSGDVGAVALHKTLSELEKNAGNFEFEQFPPLFRQLEHELEHTLVLFNAYLAAQE